MSKYDCHEGDHRDLLAEEASEVIQAIMKWKRFKDTKYNLNPRTGRTGHQQVVDEIGDFLAILQLNLDEGFFTAGELNAAKEAKHIRLKELFGLPLIENKIWIV